MKLVMNLIDIHHSFSLMLANNKKVLAIERTFQQGLQEFKDLLADFEQLHIENDNYKTQFNKQTDRCNSNTCSSAEALKKIIESKDNIIQLVASTLTRLNETKDLKILDEVFKILFGETSTPLPLVQVNIKCEDNYNTTPAISIKKEKHCSTEDLSFKDESISEIEGTPTGRLSPIIQTKKQKSAIINSTDFRDKKKCPDSWPTPDKKSVKLSFSTPTRGKQNGRLRQARLNIVKVKESNVIDITCSPEFSGGCRSNKNDNERVQPLIKKESMENDDTILPSPTSGPTNFTLFKTNDSPMKFKKPQLSLKIKTESDNRPCKKLEQSINKTDIKQEQNLENKSISDIKVNDSVTFTQEDSINILNPKRFPNNFIKHSPIKKKACNDDTYCDTDSSISLLQHVDKLEYIHKDGKGSSPTKRPLAENINITNVPDEDELQSSLSLLNREPKVNIAAVENVKRKIPDFVDEPTVRTKAEKRMLQGWSCEKCRDFFGELYKDDPVMLAKKINECSHHRGAQNPTDRPKTPPGFWNPRWEVPEDTEEFNRKNNVA